jgi:hypothetical protein
MQNHYAIVDVIDDNGQRDIKCCMKSVDRGGGSCFITINVLFLTFMGPCTVRIF